MRRFALASVVLALVFVPASSGGQAASPLIGTNYTHWSYVGCKLDDTGIVRFYHEPGVRKTVKAQLTAMRRAGVQSLRLLLWHERDAENVRWGAVPSRGGQLAEPYQTNLVQYLSDVRAAGFTQLTVSFAPVAANAPLLYSYWKPEDWDPARLEENWSLIRSVRPLIKLYGPRSTHIDLFNEGVPGTYDSPQAQMQANSYIQQLYSRYVDAFRNRDVTISTIASGAERGNVRDNTARLQNLIEDIRSTGRPFPKWFEVHISYRSTAALADLRAIDELLTRYGLSQPLVIGETAYNDAGVAIAIRTFIQTSARSVKEVMAWPLRPDRKTCVSAPHRVDAFARVLTGA